LRLRLEYTACEKRIKGESKNIRGKVPEKELEGFFMESEGQNHLPSSAPRSPRDATGAFLIPSRSLTTEDTEERTERSSRKSTANAFNRRIAENHRRLAVNGFDFQLF
jgi:hypothetical protein